MKEDTQVDTDDGPELTRVNTCTVPLSLQTQTSCSSGLKATPNISALSVPRLNSRTSFPVKESHIRTKVPREDVVAIKRPEGGAESVVRAVVCAAIMATGCFVETGGFCCDAGDGGPLGTGGEQGGRCIN